MNPAAFAARQKNERRIIEYVVNNGETSRVTLAKALNLSTATVTNIVTDLLERKLLFESRQEKSAVGRKTTLLQFNSGLHYVLTLEIRTEEQLRLTICDLTGGLLASETCSCELIVSPTCPNPQVLKNIISALNNFLQKQPEEIRSRVKMIGLCLHGMVNASQTFDCPGLNWKNLNLTMPLQAARGLPVYSEGITRILARYEMRFIDPSEKNVIYLNLSTGIGMVNFFDRKMVMGKTGIAGEVGHTSLNIHGPRCYCGNRGCFEYYCGMNSVLLRAEELLVEENEGDLFYDMVVNQKLPLTTELLFQAQKQGSLLVHEMLCEVSEYLGVGIANLYNIYDPDRVIVAMVPEAEENFVLENAKIEARSRIVNQFSRELNISGAHINGNQIHKATSYFVLAKYLDNLY